ncbi:MAG: hypothetical protein R3F19_06195 [Verrucomicrobiales bacterium]
MSILSDFFIAECSGVPSYSGDAGFPAEDRCQLKRITPLEAAGMVAAIRGTEDPISCISEIERLTPSDAEEWIMSMPQDFIDTLASTEETAVPALAERFASVTADELGWSASEFTDVVADLASLARRAKAQGKSIYLWNCL